jgi:tryptophan synthase alpha subunit
LYIFYKKNKFILLKTSKNLQKFKKYDLILKSFTFYFNFMANYTRQELLEKIKELVDDSIFISEYVIEYSQELENIEEIEKLLLITYDAYITEKALNDDEKNELTDVIVDISKKKIEIYNKTQKQIREDVEQADKEFFDEILLNF